MFVQQPIISRYSYDSSFIWEALPKNELLELENHSKIESYSKGEVIYKEGSFPKCVFIIRSGKVKIYQTDENGIRQILYFYVKGEAFGFREIISNGVYPVTAMAFEDLELTVLPSEVFTHFLDKSSFLTKNILQGLSFEFTIWMNRIKAFARKSVKQRLALGLIILNEKFKINAAEHKPVNICITRTELAEYIGVPLETLIRTLKMFKDEGLVDIIGKNIIILDYQEIVEIIGD